MGNGFVRRNADQHQFFKSRQTFKDILPHTANNRFHSLSGDDTHSRKRPDDSVRILTLRYLWHGCNSFQPSPGNLFNTAPGLINNAQSLKHTLQVFISAYADLFLCSEEGFFVHQESPRIDELKLIRSLDNTDPGINPIISMHNSIYKRFSQSYVSRSFISPSHILIQHKRFLKRNLKTRIYQKEEFI